MLKVFSPRALLLLAALAVQAGCGGTTTPIPIRVCPDFPGPPGSGDRFTFVLTEEVDPVHAPVPTNDSEAILFGLAYPTLVLADCEGGILPWAASSWDASSADTTWTFRMNPDVKFSDGTPVRAADVQKMWIGRREAAAYVAPWIWDHVRPSTVEVSRDGRLIVHARSTTSDFLHALTQPSLALGRGRGNPWSMGTRGALVAPASTGGNVDWIWQRNTRASTAASEIAFRIMKDAAPRDIAGSGADAFFVRTRAEVEQAAQLPGWNVTPLPYSRLYVLLTPENGFVGKVKDKNIEKLMALAPGDSRPARAADGYRYEAPESGERLKRTKDRIVVPWWDRDAHAIAKELSQIWLDVSDRGYPVILPKKPDDFFRHLLDGEDALYIFPVYPVLDGDSLQRLHLMRSAPWLAERGGAIPLFETRGHLVAREGLAGFASGYAGIPRLEGAGWAGGSPHR